MKASDIMVGDRVRIDGRSLRVEARSLEMCDSKVHLRLATHTSTLGFRAFDPDEQIEMNSAHPHGNPWRMTVHELRKLGT